ncbi:M20/M25/M40 family metallo-hydrolase [Rossellomorea sp. AcN35-11]|nr:M20/M25/M40 family metallo-hydrolase [Rossellomorea aquimaris]WJV29710.1 M20/M25/M40 family metallo-hydrolase [Rossellomorea sp. AcN35-11]
MYQQLKSLSLAEQCEAITRSLVERESRNGTKGEADIAVFIKETLHSFPYFTSNPDHVWEQPISNDPLGRKNIFAFVKNPTPSAHTLIYHAHLDTVGIDDYGSLKDHALNPDELESFFRHYAFDQEVQEDARSGKWLFGRGALDMKSGIAVHLANVLSFSERLDDLPGNILFMVNPDEESQHKGVISAIPELNKLKQAEGLEYTAAINTDFTTPLYKGDPHRYVYTGSAGKLLPSFYIYGRETHVGDTLAGIDSTLISSEINSLINNNVDLTEEMEGELVLPPSCLYQKDSKIEYNVQTAKSSFLYFNYFIYKLSAKEIMTKIEALTKEACRTVEAKLARNYAAFSKRSGLPEKPLCWNIEVTSLADYISYLKGLGADIEGVSQRIIDENSGQESRMISLKIVEALQQLDPDKKPRVIIFYAPPYLPHNYLNEEYERDQILLESMKQSIELCSATTGETFALKKFFPYLSDGSFLSLHETDEEIDALLRNFPNLDQLYPIPLKEIRGLNVPSITMGVYGKDGHKWTERVNKEYSFQVLPLFIQHTSILLLEKMKEREAVQTN